MVIWIINRQEKVMIKAKIIVVILITVRRLLLIRRNLLKLIGRKWKFWAYWKYNWIRKYLLKLLSSKDYVIFAIKCSEKWLKIKKMQTKSKMKCKRNSKIMQMDNSSNNSIMNSLITRNPHQQHPQPQTTLPPIITLVFPYHHHLHTINKVDWQYLLKY